MGHVLIPSRLRRPCKHGITNNPQRYTYIARTNIGKYGMDTTSCKIRQFGMVLAKAARAKYATAKATHIKLLTITRLLGATISITTHGDRQGEIKMVVKVERGGGGGREREVEREGVEREGRRERG